MNVKFKIIFDDNTTAESHDEMYNVKFDHSHFLPPFQTKKWKEYHIISDEQHDIGVNFENGIFFLNGVEVQPANDQGGVLTFPEKPNEFTVDGDQAWSLFNGNPFFPVVGRRTFKGDLYGTPIDSTVPFCGWKRIEDGVVIQKSAFLYPNGKIVIT